MAKPDLKAALAKYGYVGSLAHSIPELRDLLTQAAAGNWTAAQFSRALQDKPWWKRTSDKVKQYDVLKATKPGEFHAQRNQWISKVVLSAQKLGVRGRLVGKIGGYADAAMKLGWDDAELSRHLAGLINPSAKGGLVGGDAGSVQQQAKQLFADYGVKYSSGQTIGWARRILTGGDTLDSLRARLIHSAKSRYAAFASDLDQGKTMKDIADPYIQLMSQTLELPSESLDIYDPKVQRALQVRDPKTHQPTSTPLWQFEQDLRSDARWDRTKNARNAAYDQAMRIGQAWGFL